MRKKAKRKYVKGKSEAQKKAEMRAYLYEWRKKNPEKYRKTQLKAKRNFLAKSKLETLMRRHSGYEAVLNRLDTLEAKFAEQENQKQDSAPFEKRLAALEQENKEILLDLEEVLKDNAETRKAVKWGDPK